MKKIILTLCLCFASMACFAFCEHGVIITGKNGVQYCKSPAQIVNGVEQVSKLSSYKDHEYGVMLNWWSAFAWCQAQGMHLVSVHELCDTDDAVWAGTSNRVAGECPNFTSDLKLSEMHVFAADLINDSMTAYDIELHRGSVRKMNRLNVNRAYRNGPFAMCRP